RDRRAALGLRCGRGRRGPASSALRRSRGDPGAARDARRGPPGAGRCARGCIGRCRRRPRRARAARRPLAAERARRRGRARRRPRRHLSRRHARGCSRLAPPMVASGHRSPGLSLVSGPALVVLLAALLAIHSADPWRYLHDDNGRLRLVVAVRLFGLLRRQCSGVPALMAALALAVVPMSSYFGKLVNFEPVVLPLMVGLVLAYWRWAERNGARWLALALALTALG